jgi:ABC-type branched-subunit amino acid transport system substrate-binding protein
LLIRERENSKPTVNVASGFSQANGRTAHVQPAGIRIAWPAATAVLLGGTISASGVIDPAHAADPVKIGFSMALTGGVAANGKQLLAALEIWRDDVNAKGGLRKRPDKVENIGDRDREPGQDAKPIGRRDRLNAVPGCTGGSLV